jgi:tetratricopeptide (TPR) repeat protein
MKVSPRRRTGRKFLFGNFYLNPAVQYATTVVSSIVLAGCVFSGLLLFRTVDADDLLVRGRRQLAEGKVAWAAKTFETLVSRRPDSYDGYLLLGEAYLQLGDRKKAEQAFWTASSMKGGLPKPGGARDPQLAMALSKLAVARKQFAPAERELLALAKAQQPQTSALEVARLAPPLKEAFYTLYQQWGDHLIRESNDVANAATKYEQALRFSQSLAQDTQMKETLLETLSRDADQLDAQKRYADVASVLKKSLRYKYLPDTLVGIAEAYEKDGKIDEAIAWYRKAFDANPGVISLKLSNMLIEKGRRLVTEKKLAEAEACFNEARKVSASAAVPMEVLFPVRVSGFTIKNQADVETGEVHPSVKVTFFNEADRPLTFLRAKASFWVDGNLVAEQVAPVANEKAPLAPKGKGGRDGKSSLLVTLSPETPLSLADLRGKMMRVKLSVAYTDEANTPWKELAIQEAEMLPGPTPPSPEN